MSELAAPINWKHSADCIAEGMDFVSKKVGKWVVEMFYRPDGGAMIVVWEPATADDIESAEKLPHIYQLSEDKKWNKFGEFHYAYSANAKEAYGQRMKSQKAIVHFAYENM